MQILMKGLLKGRYFLKVLFPGTLKMHLNMLLSKRSNNQKYNIRM